MGYCLAGAFSSTIKDKVKAKDSNLKGLEVRGIYGY